MPFDGSGTFNRVMNWVNDAAAAIKIKADRHDLEDDNFAAGLSNTLTKDGQSQPTANIPMNGKRLINLGAPTTATDAATKSYVDTADGLLAPKASPTFTGKVTLPTGVAGTPPVNWPNATAAPTTPADGDIWPDSAGGGLKHRIAGVTYTYARLEAAQQAFTGKIALGNGPFGTNTRSGLTSIGDISLVGGYFLGLNVYYDTTATTYKAASAGFGSTVSFDPASGQVFFLRSSATAVANAAFASMPAWLTAHPTTGVSLVNAGTFTWNGGDVLVDNVNNLGLAAGFGQATFVNDGAKASGTYTPSPAGGNMRYATCSGAFALGADANATTAYTMIVGIENVAGAGAITASGWSKVSGDPFDATVGSRFLCYITKLGSFKELTVEKIA